MSSAFACAPPPLTEKSFLVFENFFVPSVLKSSTVAVRPDAFFVVELTTSADLVS